MRRSFSTLANVVLIAALLAFAACVRAATFAPSVEPISLVDRWAFHPGDDMAWATPGFNDNAWPRLRVPGSWRRQGFPDLTGYAWYRVKVPLSWPAGEALGLTLGKIDTAYEVYAGGQRLGGVGALPPNARAEYDRHRTYSIPPAARDADGSIVLALRVWRDPRKLSTAAGPVEGPFEIGPLARVIERETLAEAGPLVLVLVFLLVAAYHLTLRVGLGAGTDYAWFGALALLAAVYGFLRTQWKYVLFDDFLMLKKIEHFVLWLIPAVLLQFMWVFFKEPPPRWLRLAQMTLVAGALAVVLTPGLTVAQALLQGLQFSVIPLIVVSLALVIRRLAAGDREARIVGAGFAVLAATILHDALVDRSYLMDTRVAVYGFGFLVVGMSVTLGLRFQRALGERDALTRDLERRVDARTRELNAAYQAMEDLALHDSLTQLLNRRAIHNRAASELARARRSRAPFTMAMIDIDYFKTVNDTFGHDAGDRVLAEVARRLTRAVRVSDDVGRWGGEEFVVLMPGTGRQEAALTGERLRSIVADPPMAITAVRAQTVTVSIGLSTIEADEHASVDLATLIRLADEALYRAKADGRNTARVAAAACSAPD